jgi:ABC-type transporter Mla MlaB component
VSSFPLVGLTQDEGKEVLVAHGLRPPPGPKTVVLVVAGTISRATVPGLCERVHRLLDAGRADLVTCDVAALAHPDVAAIDALAFLQLTARRQGGAIRLRNAPVKLRDLLALIGLVDVLAPVGLCLEPERQPEQREQVRLDEEVDPADPSV